MSLDRFIEHYGSESQCQYVLEKARWGRGFNCPKCGGSSYSFFYRKNQKIWQCSAHKHQVTLRTETIFHASKLPLRKWFLAMFLTTLSITNISVLSLMRYLGVSYPTAWLVKRKLMQIMAEKEDCSQLDGRVVADDAYLGGVTSGGKRGRGAKKGGLFMSAVEAEVDSSVRYVRFDLLPDLSGDSIKDWDRKGVAQ